MVRRAWRHDAADAVLRDVLRVPPRVALPRTVVDLRGHTWGVVSDLHVVVMSPAGAVKLHGRDAGWTVGDAAVVAHHGEALLLTAARRDDAAATVAADELCAGRRSRWSP